MATQLGDFTAGQILTADDMNDIAVWTDYTPTFAAGVTVGNGTWVAGFSVVNEILFWQGTFTFGSTSAVTGSVTINVPSGVTFSSANNEILGNVRMTAGGTTFYGLVRENGTNQVTVLVYNAASTYLQSALLSSTVPGTWTNNDNIQISYVARIN
jgi:hypothetical protein